MTWARWTEGRVLLALRWRKHQISTAFGNNSGSPDTLWHILSSRTPLFGYVKVRVTNVSDWRSASMEVAVKTLGPNMNAMFSRRKGLMSDLELVYYPGWKRNKYATISMLFSDRRMGSPEAEEMIEMCQGT